MSDDIVSTESAGPTRWEQAKAWVIGLTGVLLVFPALINSAVDIYKAILNVPSTEAEAINTQLFKAHFQELPLTVVPVSIKTDSGTVVMQMSIYENGDIYAEYGFHSQWFPMPVNKQAIAFNSLPLLFSSAYAENRPHELNQPITDNAFIQQDIIHNNQIKRSRYYNNGQLETFSIDIQTGEIKNKQSREVEKVPQTGTTPSVPVKKRPKFQPMEVDLVNLKKQKNNSQ
ncbi:hypothetical protein [Spartinivicinus poritis]|uniref:Uncharacterized protein n=1 Tax=Spartinivicinus poritis TaxID=2994640 RepID=A0ABT5UDZ9_9GAMM|nr:hypothetical protein [Spartinivicinus sp. A2-2]MDE1464236.1 hypothetical protein [Spartinivicinus sp. A2-2]